MRVPAEEYIAIFSRFEYVGFCFRWYRGARPVHDRVRRHRDRGPGRRQRGQRHRDQFTLAFYSEDVAATVDAAVAPDLTSAPDGRPVPDAEHGHAGPSQRLLVQHRAAGWSLNVQRTVTGGIDGSVFCGVALNEEADGNSLTLPFLSGADLSGAGLAEFDLCNGAIDPRTTADAAGHGLTGALGPSPSCAGGYVYIDDPATAALDFFGPFAIFVALLHEDATFKTLVRTDQDGGVTAGGNMPSTNVAPVPWRSSRVGDRSGRVSRKTARRTRSARTTYTSTSVTRA